MFDNIKQTVNDHSYDLEIREKRECQAHASTEAALLVGGPIVGGVVTY